MAKTISDCRSRVRMYLDEATQADWTDTEVDREINVAYHEMVSAVINTFEDFYLTTDTFNTTTDQQEYDSDDGLATDILKIKRVEINMKPSNSNSVAVRALPINIEAIKTRLANTNIGTFHSPAYYIYGFESNLKIGFLPIPDDGGTGAGKIWYVQRQADLSDSNTSVNIPYPDQYYNLIAKGSAAELLRKGQQEEVVARQYRLEFEAGLEKMKIELEDRIADYTKSIVDNVGDWPDFGNPIY